MTDEELIAEGRSTVLSCRSDRLLVAADVITRLTDRLAELTNPSVSERGDHLPSEENDEDELTRLGKATGAHPFT